MKTIFSFEGKEMKSMYPYPGLRPFHHNEIDIFFGREEQTHQLLDKLDASHFLAVTGPSGCGKSSLVRAGMIASLEAGFMTSAGISWRIAEMRPGSHPIKRLAKALLPVLENRVDQDEEVAIGFLYATLKRGPRGLTEILKETPLPPKMNLLILVDQFEEIFRFHRDGNSDEADAFVALLLKAASQREFPIYIVLTMRSDFVGDCGIFTGLTQALNESQFLTPQLSREQSRRAIVGPVKVFGGNVEPAFLNRLLNDMGPNPDQLPLMQHLLMRIWTKKQKNQSIETSAPSFAGPPAERVTGPVFTLEDYEKEGGITRALSLHADEVLDNLDPGKQRIAEVVFRCLSERGPDNRDTRHPMAVESIAQIAGVSWEEVKEVVEVFRHRDCNFITPAAGERIYPNTVLDISHESLIRQWDRLKTWVEKETKSAENYRVLEQIACRWKEGKAALWGNPDLSVALKWKEEEKPTPEWAKRYDGDFKLAMKYLNASEKKDKKNKILRRLLIVFGFALLVFSGGCLLYFYSFVTEYPAYYNSFVKRFGSPEGIDPLNLKQRKSRPYSIKLVRKGRNGPVIRMEIVNSRGELTPYHDIHSPITPVKLIQEDIPLTRECRWDYLLDKENRVVYENAYNRFNQLVWVLSYTPLSKDTTDKKPTHIFEASYRKGEISIHGLQSGRNLIRIFYSEEGFEIKRNWIFGTFPIELSEYETFKIKREYNPAAEGLVSEVIFLGFVTGEPQPNDIGITSLKILEYDTYGNPAKIEARDINGDAVCTKEGWTRITQKFDPVSGMMTQRKFLDKDGKPVLNADKYHCVDIMYIKNGAEREYSYKDIDEKTNVLSSSHYARVETAYDPSGNQTEVRFYDEKNNPTSCSTGYSILMCKYDKKNNRVEQHYKDSNGNLMLIHKGYAIEKKEFDDFGRELKASYYGIDEKPTNHKEGYCSITKEYDEQGNMIERRYCDEAGNLINCSAKWAIEKKVYDTRRNIIEVSYLNEDESPVVPLGFKYTKRTMVYDLFDNMIEAEYFKIGPGGKLIVHYIEKREFDPYQNNTARAYFDENNNPIILEYCGCHMERIQYDVYGQEISQLFFNKKGQLHDSKIYGYAQRTQKYDEAGNCTGQTYFNSQKEPIKINRGYARIEYEYDDYGKRIKRRTYDADGKLLKEVNYN